MSTVPPIVAPSPAIGEITRYRLYVPGGKFAWYYGYSARVVGGPCSSCRGDCTGHDFGRFPLASVRHFIQRWGAARVVETWKVATDAADAEGR